MCLSLLFCVSTSNVHRWGLKQERERNAWTGWNLPTCGHSLGSVPSVGRPGQHAQHRMMPKQAPILCRHATPYMYETKPQVAKFRNPSRKYSNICIFLDYKLVSYVLKLTVHLTDILNIQKVVWVKVKINSFPAMFSDILGLHKINYFPFTILDASGLSQ